jgi:hypothetical protein
LKLLLDISLLFDGGNELPELVYELRALGLSTSLSSTVAELTVMGPNNAPLAFIDTELEWNVSCATFVVYCHCRVKHAQQYTRSGDVDMLHRQFCEL